MLITTIELAKEPILLDEKIPAGTIEYAADVHQIGAVTVVGQADLLQEHRGPKEIVDDIRVRARFAGEFELLCARCLDPVPESISGDFDLIFRPEDVDAEMGEHAITEEETEIGYYEGGGLLLEDVVREQVLLSLPGRTLCQVDCRGLCPQCGKNRNQTECTCVEAPAHPGWSALAGLNLSVGSPSKDK